MKYADLAKKICEEMLNYPVSSEGLLDVYDFALKKHGKEYMQDKEAILAKVTHHITIMGYDIECIKPLKFKSYID